MLDKKIELQVHILPLKRVFFLQFQMLSNGWSIKVEGSSFCHKYLGEFFIMFMGCDNYSNYFTHHYDHELRLLIHHSLGLLLLPVIIDSPNPLL